MNIKKKLSKGDLTRLRIIQASLKIFSKDGFTQGSLQQITQKCGLSQSAMFHYFPNRFSLIEAVLLHIVIENHTLVSSLANAEDNARTRLEKHFFGNLKWSMSFPDQAKILVLVYYLASFDETFRKLYTSLLEKARNRILEYLFAGEREGLLKNNVDKTLAAQILHNVLVGSLINFLSSDMDLKSKIRQEEFSLFLKKQWSFVVDDFFK